MTESLFWIFLALIAYTYMGYTLLLVVLNFFRMILSPRKKQDREKTEYPGVTLLIAAYNERYLIESKIRNSRALNYPASTRTAKSYQT